MQCRHGSASKPEQRNGQLCILACRTKRRVRARIRCTQCVGFHQDRMKATAVATKLPPLTVQVYPACSDAERQAAAKLRAKSFYVYRPERAFAGACTQALVSFARRLARQCICCACQHAVKHHAGLHVATSTIWRGRGRGQGSQKRCRATRCNCKHVWETRPFQNEMHVGVHGTNQVAQAMRLVNAALFRSPVSGHESS